MTISIYLNQLLTTFGLLMDIFGAYFLAQSFIAKNIAEVYSENQGTLFSPIPLKKLLSEIEQKAEANVGFRLLFSGFSMQIVSILIPEIELPLFIGALLIIFVVF